MAFRHALKEDFSNYRSNIIVQNGNSEAAVKAAQALANKHPESSIFLALVYCHKSFWQNP
jgi:accessory colonization factor AcfC